MSDLDVFEVDRPGGKPREPFFCFTHGAGGDLSSGGLKSISAALAGAGHLSVRMNLAYRAAGRSSPPAAEKSVPGFIETYEQVRSEFGPGAVWIAGGRSYGGRVASMAAAQGLEAAGLVFFPYPLHRPGDPSNPRIEHWPRIQMPCLFVQGTNDPFCDTSVLEMSLPSLGGDTALLLVEGGDHSLKVGRKGASAARPKSEAEVTRQVVAGVVDWLKKI